MYQFLVAVLFLFIPQLSFAQLAKVRGVDFRMQMNFGTLDFLGVSGTQRTFSGFGSELSSHLYLFEKGRWRSNFFVASRVMSYTGQGVLGSETDDLQIFTVSPAFELSYGIIHLQAGYQFMNVNSYYVSAFSTGKSFAVSSPVLGAHLNFRLGNLGLGIGATKVNLAVDPVTLGLPASTNCQWNEISYSINFIYFIGLPPSKFFPALFK